MTGSERCHRRATKSSDSLFGSSAKLTILRVCVGRDVCDGLQIGVDNEQILDSGRRYRDKRPMAQKMWATIMTTPTATRSPRLSPPQPSGGSGAGGLLLMGVGK
jgi:hypothetical protein